MSILHVCLYEHELWLTVLGNSEKLRQSSVDYFGRANPSDAE